MAAPRSTVRTMSLGALLGAALVAALPCGTTLAAPTPARKPSVEVFGDRDGTLLASGLGDSDAAVSVSPVTTDTATLSGPGYDGWLRSLRERLARPSKPDAAVVMVGRRDRGPLVDGPARLEPGSPAWISAYGARIDAVARLFADARVPLVWVGLPPVRDRDGAADISRVDGLLRDRAGADGFDFVDVWSGFTDDQGRYSPDGPDAEGRPARLRRGDGFTPAGVRKLASYVAPEVDRLIGRKRAAAPDLANLTIERARDFDAALAVDVNAEIRREAARDTAGQQQPTPPVGPAAGPIVPLTNAAPPPGAELAALPATEGMAASPPAEVAPEPGRADDFSWPKPANAP